MKNIGFKILYLVTVLVMVIELGCAVYSSLFTDIADVPTGRLIGSSVSPAGTKTLRLYLIENNLGVAVRGEIEKEDDRYNIFWQTGIDDVDVKWLDDNSISLNEIPIDANDTFGYDCRRGYSLFDEGSISPEFVESEE